MAAQRYLDYEGDGQIAQYPLAPSQTFVVGDFLIFDSSGRLQIDASAGSNVGATSGITNAIAGRALENALKDDGTIKTYVSIYVAHPRVLFKVYLYHGTAASAVFNSNMVGNANYEMRNTTAGIPAVDISATTNVKCRIQRPDPVDYPGWPVTTGAGTVQYPAVWIAVMSAHSALGGFR